LAASLDASVHVKTIGVQAERNCVDVAFGSIAVALGDVHALGWLLGAGLTGLHY
jgi:hypothetical protein